MAKSDQQSGKQEHKLRNHREISCGWKNTRAGLTLVYIASHPNTWKPWRWHFRSVLHLLFSNSRDHLTFSLRLQHSARAWRMWWGLQLFISLCPPSLGIHKGHLRGSCSHSNLSWAQMGSWRHQSQIHGQSRCHPPSSLPQIHYGTFLSAESALNQKLFPFPGRAMTFWRHRGKPGAAAGTEEDICLKGDTAQSFSAMSPEERTRELPVGALWTLDLENS